MTLVRVLYFINLVKVRKAIYINIFTQVQYHINFSLICVSRVVTLLKTLVKHFLPVSTYTTIAFVVIQNIPAALSCIIFMHSQSKVNTPRSECFV